MAKKKWMIGIGVALIVVGGYGFTQYQTYAKAEEEKQALQVKQEKIDKKVTSYEKEAVSFYLNNNKELLAQDVTIEDVEALKRKLQLVEKQEMRAKTEKKWNTATVDTINAGKMIVLREKVNQLVDKNGALTEKANVADAEKQAKDLKEIKPVFYAAQNKKIQEAKRQQMQITKAKQAVDALFTDATRKNIKPNVKRDQFQAALNEKNKVKQPKAKQMLIQDLNRVENYLINQEKQAAAQQAQEVEQSKNEDRTEVGNKEQDNSQKATSKSKSPSDKSMQGEKPNNYSSSSKKSHSSTPGSSYTAPNSSKQGSSSSTSGKSSAEKSSGTNKGTNDTHSSTDKDSYDTSEEGINGTTENQNGGTDISWGWN
jgi:hypothetical protein